MVEAQEIAGLKLGFSNLCVERDESFSAKYSRSNQSGQVCYCMFGTDQANQKTKDGWQKVDCLGQECQYRQKKENGPSDCKKVGWLKFLIPKIAVTNR